MGLETIEADGQVKYDRRPLDTKGTRGERVVSVNELVDISKSQVAVGIEQILRKKFFQVRLIVAQDEKGNPRMYFCPRFQAEARESGEGLINAVLVGVRDETPTYYVLRPSDPSDLSSNDNPEYLASEGDQLETKIEIRARNSLELKEGEEYFLVFIHFPSGQGVNDFTDRIKGGFRQKGGVTWLNSQEALNPGWRYVTVSVTYRKGHLYPDTRGVEILRIIR